MQDGRPLLVGDDSNCVLHVAHNAHGNLAHANIVLSIDVPSISVQASLSTCGHVVHAESPS